MKTNITFTQAATIYIEKILAHHPGQYFRLSIKKTGCSGYSYFPNLVEEINPSDLQVKMNESITIFIDAKWRHLLQELQVDYIEDDKTGLKQKRLVFINPNETSRCGCGESFHVEKDHV